MNIVQRFNVSMHAVASPGFSARWGTRACSRKSRTQAESRVWSIERHLFNDLE